MPKNKKTFIGGTVGVFAAAGVAAVLVFTGRQGVLSEEPVDIVHDFYKSWLAAAQSTSTDPYREKLGEQPFLGKELRAKIRAAGATGDVLDPVLCQTEVPARIAQRSVSRTETRSEFLVTARESTSTAQAIVTLLPLRDGWYIDGIQCSPGEFAPEREFSFEGEGELLSNVPAPLVSGHWHLAFEQDGQPERQYVPLFFGPESQCLAAEGASIGCGPDAFAEASRGRVRGEMTESGVNVRHLELVR